MAVTLRSVSKVFEASGNPVHALRDVSFDMQDGEITAVVGPSGSGKSTLLNLLGLLERPTSGDYFLDALPVAGRTERELARLRNRHFGFIFQSFQLVDYLDAVSNVELPLLYSDLPRSQRRERARQLLADVGLSDRLTHRPSELSGGERQRLAIARAMSNRPKILLADEPTGSLDSATAKMVVDILLDLRKTHRVSILLVTHNMDVARVADRICEMKDGYLCASPTPLN